MADIQYKKGELLFSGDITTENQEGINVGTSSISKVLTQKLMVEFNGIEYICSAIVLPSGYSEEIAYGGVNTSNDMPDMPDFTDYPFCFTTFTSSQHSSGGALESNTLSLATEFPGTYNLKIYEAVVDISNITFKKGELLLNETFETVKPDEQSSISVADKSISTNITENIVFTEYPFIFSSIEAEGQKIADLVTPDSGTYTLKVYTAVEDTDSSPLSPTDFIIAYLMKSPQNSNWNVLSSLLGDGDWSRLKAYVETTPKNMNRQVLKVLLGGGSSGSSAVVGTAVVGRDTVG